MAGWVGQAPALLVAIAIIVLPGLPAALCLRGSGLQRLGAAIALRHSRSSPPASVVAPWLGLGWSPLPVAIVASIVTVVAAVLRLDRSWGAAGRHTAPSPRLGCPERGIPRMDRHPHGRDRRPLHPSQLYDGLFHLNAVEFIVQNSDASPLHMTMVTPGASSAPTPLCGTPSWRSWFRCQQRRCGDQHRHGRRDRGDLAGRTRMPRVVLFRAHPAAAFWAPLVAFGFSVYPLGFLNWGVLYPNLLGNVLLPLFLAFVIRAFSSGDGPAGRTLWILTAAAAAGASAAAHPSSLLAGVVLVVPFVVWQVLRPWRTASRGRRAGIIVGLVVGFALLVAVWLAANVTTHEWLPGATMSQALGEVAFLSPVGRSTGLLLGLLAAIGIWRVVKDRQWWVLFAYGVSIVFYLASAWLPCFRCGACSWVSGTTTPREWSACWRCGASRSPDSVQQWSWRGCARAGLQAHERAWSSSRCCSRSPRRAISVRWPMMSRTCGTRATSSRRIPRDCRPTRPRCSRRSPTSSTRMTSCSATPSPERGCCSPTPATTSCSRTSQVDMVRTRNCSLAISQPVGRLYAMRSPVSASRTCSTSGIVSSSRITGRRSTVSPPRRLDLLSEVDRCGRRRALRSHRLRVGRCSSFSASSSAILRANSVSWRWRARFLRYCV